MQDLSDILTPARTLCGAPGVSKKRLFETIAGIIAEDQPSMAYDSVFDQLIAREKLGSTGLGQGIAIPHCRATNCDSIAHAIPCALLCVASCAGHAKGMLWPMRPYARACQARSDRCREPWRIR